MPRMRGLSDAIFYRPAQVDPLSSISTRCSPGTIDWDLIATHARDMIQVVLSIQAGRVMPSMLLRKLGTYNRRSLLYRAFRELGRVERTLFLLRFISSAEVRRIIRAETTKIETYNDFLDWVSLRRAGDQERRSGRAGEAAQIRQPRRQRDHAVQRRRPDRQFCPPWPQDGHPVTPGLVACLSPYIREHIRRFGRYALDMEDLPRPLDPQPLPFEPAL